MPIQHKSTEVPELYFHIREAHTAQNGKEFKAATVFARHEADVGWIMTIARCSKEDNFSRSQGRNISRRKWFKEMRKPVPADISVLTQKPRYEHAEDFYRNI